VRQEGYEPGSSTFKMQRFILQKDGRWLLNLAFVMLPEAEQEAQLVSQPHGGAANCFDELSSKPVRASADLPAGANAEEILAHFEQCTHRILRGMRSCYQTTGTLEHGTALRSSCGTSWLL
jgi:hypothetical protein